MKTVERKKKTAIYPVPLDVAVLGLNAVVGNVCHKENAATTHFVTKFAVVVTLVVINAAMVNALLNQSAALDALLAKNAAMGAAFQAMSVATAPKTKNVAMASALTCLPAANVGLLV